MSDSGYVDSAVSVNGLAIFGRVPAELNAAN